MLFKSPITPHARVLTTSATLSTLDIRSSEYTHWYTATSGQTYTLPTPNKDLAGMFMGFVNNSSGNATIAGTFVTGSSITIGTKQSCLIVCLQLSGSTYKWVKLSELGGTTELSADELAAVQGAASPGALNVFATMADIELTADELAAIQGAASPDGTNVFATMADAPTADELAAIQGAATPTASNVFATIADVGGTAGTLGTLINSASAKSPPIDADLFVIADTEASNIAKKVTGTALKAYLKTYLDTLYCGISAIGARIAAADAKAVPIDTDSIAICDSEAANATKETTFTQLKAFLKTYFDTQYPAETTTTVGTLINGATAKATPIDADLVGFADTQASNVIKKATWAEIKAFLKTYFDTVYGTAAYAAFSPTAVFSGGTAATVSAEVYRQKTIYDHCDWIIDIALSDGGGNTTLTVDFPAALVPTDVNVLVPCKAQVSVNGGAYSNVLATLNCEAAASGDRQLVVACGTLTDDQAARIIISGSHQITPA